MVEMIKSEAFEAWATLPSLSSVAVKHIKPFVVLVGEIVVQSAFLHANSVDRTCTTNRSTRINVLFDPTILLY
jgi:hypothetical protein